MSAHLSAHRSPLPATADAARLIEESLGNVREALGRLRFGSVQLTVHEGRVVQIDITEKLRISAP